MVETETAGTQTGQNGTSDDVLLDVKNLQMFFPVTSGIIFQKLVGEVKAVAVRPDLVNEETLDIDPVGLDTIGRLGGNLYTRTKDSFEMKRPSKF